MYILVMWFVKPCVNNAIDQHKILKVEVDYVKSVVQFKDHG